MKVFYNSKLAKAVTFMNGFKTIMLFGHVFTEKSYLDEKTLEHEKTHCLQYCDCSNLGLAISLILLFIFFGLNLVSWWLFILLLIPLLLFYIWYGLEFLILLGKGYNKKDAYRNIGFERQARWCSETWDKPCEEKNHYTQFGWITQK